MKKAVYLVGIGLVIGGAAAIYLLSKKETSHTVNDFSQEPETASEKEEILAEKASKQHQAEYGGVKSRAVENMYTRHTDAAEVVKSAVEVIHENAKTSEKVNNDIDAISAELDEMMGEN